MKREEIKAEIDRQLEFEIVENKAMPPGYMAIVQDGKMGVIARVDDDSIYARAMAGRATEEELQKLVDAPSEFELVRQELTVEELEKARRERRCPRCMALLMETGLPKGKCPNDCPE